MVSGTGLVATAQDLPSPVADALAAPSPGEQGSVDAGGERWHFVAWGSPDDPPLLLTHGVCSSARGWWRVGPAFAAAGRRVVALDMPGHGSLDQLEALTLDPGERRYESFGEARAVVRANNPAWSDGDVAAKAYAMT
jgi:pimeloyl-ACP methyl ester carboxylesterase